MNDLAAAIDLPRPVAFVLSGGTSLGAIQVGMLRALHERGIAPDLLVGSSVGAINAAFIGGAFTADRVDALAALWSRVRAEDVFGAPGIRRTVRMLLGRGALAAPVRLRELLARQLPARHSDLSTPTAVVATDLLTGDPVVLEDGDLLQSVLASTAIPGVFPAVVIGGRSLADGGIAAHAPVLQAADLGAASVVVLDASYPCALTELPRGLVPNAVRLLNLMLRHQSVVALTILGARLPVVYLPSPCPLGVAPWDFTRSAELVEMGHGLSARFLGQLRVHGPGVYGHPHIHDGGECPNASPRPHAALAAAAE